jgi:poly(3-hydroxyalkanoate) synthetase
MTVLGLPVDLTEVEVDAYVTGRTTDHLTPWRTCAPAAARSQQAGSTWGTAMAGGHLSDTGYGQSRR